MAKEIGGLKIEFGDPRQPKALPLTHPIARWDPKQFGTKSYVLKKGHVRRRGCLPLPCDIQFDRDVPILLRDGVKIYIDVYRPVDDHVKVPAIMAWSPYGKQGGLGNQVLDDFPFRFGVPLRKLSEFQKWEAPDPGYWVQHGYAIINPDPRGVGMSEGNIYALGTQEGRDGADVVDWAGSQSWCNGKVAMSGNSYVAISQWFIAAEKPKHLAAIAPWEGFSDAFKEFGTRGGAPSVPLANFSMQIAQISPGNNSWENSYLMGSKHLPHSEYHEDKAAAVEKIDVPAYVVASWTNPVHVYGTFRAYMRLKCDKWLRIHDTIEWPDYYEERWRADLHRFFDWSLKGIDNGWEATPRVRAKIIDTASPVANTGHLVKLPSFPPPQSDTALLKLYFNAADRSLDTLYPSPASSEYAAHDQEISFEYPIHGNVVLCGPIELFLSVSLRETDDSNIFVTMAKILPSGSVAEQLIVPFERGWQSSALRAVHALGVTPLTKAAFHRGPNGRARVGQRLLVAGDAAVPGFPVSRMDTISRVAAGEVVRVQVGMTPIGMRFSKGERLRVTVGGVDHAVFPPVAGATLTVDLVEQMVNHGYVTVHTGARETELASYMTLPVLAEDAAVEALLGSK